MTSESSTMGRKGEGEGLAIETGAFSVRQGRLGGVFFCEDAFLQPLPTSNSARLGICKWRQNGRDFEPLISLAHFVQIIPRAGGPDQKSDRHWLIGPACITAGVIMSKCNSPASHGSPRGAGGGSRVALKSVKRVNSDHLFLFGDLRVGEKGKPGPPIYGTLPSQQA